MCDTRERRVSRLRSSRDTSSFVTPFSKGAICTKDLSTSSLVVVFLLLICVLPTEGCTTPVNISVEGGNPPVFNFTGDGYVDFIRVYGPKTSNEDAPLIWMIAPSGTSGAIVNEMPPLRYGEIPAGFRQDSPKDGPPSSLLEGVVYQVQLKVVKGENTRRFFVIRNGKAVEYSGT